MTYNYLIKLLSKFILLNHFIKTEYSFCSNKKFNFNWLLKDYRIKESTYLVHFGCFFYFYIINYHRMYASWCQKIEKESHLSKDHY